ncbi:jg26703, partial [Pararge aegeria aegeria]
IIITLQEIKTELWYDVDAHPAEVVPHEVVDHCGSHAARAKGARVELVRGPLDPAGLRRRAVHQHQCVHL